MNKFDNPVGAENVIPAAIDAAEDLTIGDCDRLTGLVENTPSDPGALFGPDPVSLLAYLEGVSQFETARLLSRMVGLDNGENST